MSIQNIIFDLGGVIIKHDPTKLIDSLRFSKEEKEHLFEILSSPHFWDDLDLGKYENISQALPHILEEYPHEKEILSAFFSSSFMGHYDLYPFGLDLYTKLNEKGYGIYILSNFSKDGIASLKKSFSFFSLADGMLISSSVHLIKPDKRIFRLLIEKYDLMAEECLFLDDREENVLSAKDVGFHSIVYKEETILDELKKYEIEL